MKNIRKFVAALIVLTMVLSLAGTAFASSAKFTKKDIEDYVQFKGNLYAYNKHSASSKSNIIVKKGSTALVTGVYGKKWVQLQITTDGKKMWFGVDKLKKLGYDEDLSIHVIFASGGSGLSKERERDFFEDWKGIKIKTSGKVNLRKYASLQGKSYGTVKKGKKLTLTGWYGEDNRGVTFFQVKANGGKYFISGEYIKDLVKFYHK